MNIQLNGQPIEVDGLTPEVTLGGLVEALSAELRDQGLTIVKVTADGTDFDPEDAASLEAKKVLDCAQVDLLAATARDLVRLMVKDSAEVLPYFAGLAKGIADDLRVGRVKEGLEHFLELVDGLEWLAAVLGNLPSGFASPMQESGLEMQRQQVLAKVREHLDLLRTSQETQDWVGLADALEYEFPGLFQASSDLFRALPAD
ncbi:MAG: hypothetical protein GX442_18105 [Candidatus Riflebacteria bacterium]|nr:hypothetical protein [Candidatus Riflebacteria bacterium]